VLPILEAIWYTRGINLKDWTYEQIQMESTYKTNKNNLKIRVKAIQIRMIDCNALTIYLINCAKHVIYNIFSWRETEPQGNNPKHLKANKHIKGNHIDRQHILVMARIMRGNKKNIINNKHANYIFYSISNNHILIKVEIKSDGINVNFLRIFFLITIEILGYFYPINPLVNEYWSFLTCL